jgi:NTP pyrophosphatase (non-canonical NTP hydrolase)
VTLDEIVADILQFRDERDWKQFHTPKNLADALSIEVSELQEVMLWKTDVEVAGLVQSFKGKKRLEEELADVFIYALLFAHQIGIDPIKAIEQKLIQNSKKYPVDLSKGNAVKYSERKQLERKEGTSLPLQDSLFPTLV